MYVGSEKVKKGSLKLSVICFRFFFVVGGVESFVIIVGAISELFWTQMVNKNPKFSLHLSSC